MLFTKPHKRRGMTLVEVVIAASIVASFLIALVAVYNVYLKLALTNSNTIKAAYLAEEGVEVMKYFRDTSWTSKIGSLSTTTTYRIVYEAGWITITSNYLVDGIFDRTINVEDVFRDGSSNIASSGTYDPNTKKITVSVSWPKQGTTTTKTMSTYVVNLFRN